jgi:two-component system cell cycle sensor histidine kinase/response regulator CckA
LYGILEKMPVACHEIGISGEVVFVNEAECRLLGLRREQLLGHAIWEFVAPEERSVSEDAVRRKMAGLRTLAPFERDYVRPDGARLVLEIHEKHIHDENSRIVGMRSFLIDVTQRKRTEQALEVSEKLYRHLVDHASDIIYRTDLQGRFQIFNAIAPRLLGYPAEDLIGKTYLHLIRPDFRARVRRFYREQLTRKLSHTYLEFPAVANDGSEIWFGQNVEIIEEDGLTVGFQAITRDITRQRRQEEVLKGAQEDLERRVRDRTAELEQANERLRHEIAERQREEKSRRELEAKIQHNQRLESLGVLAGGIAHDFNNLLAVVMGHAGLALPQIPEGSSARTSIEEVISAAKSAAQLTQQMLAYSGRGKFIIAPIDINHLIEDATRLIATLISKKAMLQLNLAPGLPTVEGDCAQLRQVLVNLLTNASDALGDSPGAIQVTTGIQLPDGSDGASVSPQRRSTDGAHVFIEVVDNGCGMDRATIGKIFDPFFTTKFTGRGLGLAAVQGIIRGHHGKLQVHSEPGRGSTFRVLFPASGKPVPYSATPEAICDTDCHLEGTVLIVDDELAVRSLASQILAGAGVTVLTAVDGCDALLQFEAHSQEIHAVLLDLTMPGLDGGEVFQRLIQSNPLLKVVLCSGYGARDADSKCGAHRPAGFLRKPYSPAELIHSFRRILPTATSQRSGPQ